MKIAQINSVKGGSTGNICHSVSELLTEAGVENYVLFGTGTPEAEHEYCYSNPGYVKRQAIKSKLNGRYGFNANGATRRLIRALKTIKPDVVQLHNIHTHDCNIEKLFGYLKAKNIKTYWTFHDCWAFTGGCAHYDGAGCDKFTSGCESCPQRKRFSFFKDTAAANLRRKEAAVEGMDLTIIAPSEWMKKQVERSILGGREVVVINNGVDLETFSPTESDFRDRQGLTDKKIYLAVASAWTSRKGLEYILTLAEKLDDKEVIVLVGAVPDGMKLPENIVSIGRTQSAKELAEIYSAADVFINTTIEDTFPTVNMEALACGTPVVTFDTGGSAEIIDDMTGIAVPKGDVEALLAAVRHISLRTYAIGAYGPKACRKRAEERYDSARRLSDYVKLYQAKWN